MTVTSDEPERAGGADPAEPAGLTGHRLARRQLEDLERLCGGDLEIVSSPGDEPGPFIVSLSTDGIAPGPGIRLRPRERFRIYVGHQFPFSYPLVFAEHTRWSGTPHVQWGSYLCLYVAASVEWNAADGMRGFLDRLLAWLENAAAGNLDPDDRPLHPPANSGAAKHGRLVVRPDLRGLVPWSSRGPVVPDPAAAAEPVVVYGWCVRERDRFEVLEWLTAVEAYERVLSADLLPQDARGRCHFVMPLAMLETHLGWEYPKQAATLAGYLERAGFGRQALLRAMVAAVRMNRLIRMAEPAEEHAPVVSAHAARAEDEDEADRFDVDPILFGLATPSRRVAHDRLAHVVAWKIDSLGVTAIGLLRRLSGLDEPPVELVERVDEHARGWIEKARLAWVQVYEMRPEVTVRRDEGSSSAWLRDKSILLLGAGAIGAVVAEHAVRAGAARLVIVDNGFVNPGILVRQPYYDEDVGEAKVDALASRLNRVVRSDLVEPVFGDCHDLVLDGQVGGEDGFTLDLTEFDVILEATADAGTRAVLERSRLSDVDAWPPIVTMLLGHDATRAVAVVAGRGAACSSHEVLRRFAVRGRGPQWRAWTDLVDDFYPDPPRSELFLPEPGCSEPTFVGSASDVAALAASMLVYSLQSLAELQQDPASARIRLGGFRAPSIGQPTGRSVAFTEMLWMDDLLETDPTSGYRIRITAEALAEMRSEVRRGARARGPSVETGGLMLGSFDEATLTVTVDVASGPAPDSLLSDQYFLHGIEGTQKTLDSFKRTSRGLTRFVGLWHCHPYGLPRPSPTDRAGITVLTSFTAGARRSLMVILAGSAATWDSWVRDGETLPQAFVQVVTASSPVPDAPAFADRTVTVADVSGGARIGLSGSVPLSGRGGHDRAGLPAAATEQAHHRPAHAALTPYQRMLQSPPRGMYFAGGYSDRSSLRDEESR